MQTDILEERDFKVEGYQSSGNEAGYGSGYNSDHTLTYDDRIQIEEEKKQGDFGAGFEAFNNGNTRSTQRERGQTIGKRKKDTVAQRPNDNKDFEVEDSQGPEFLSAPEDRSESYTESKPLEKDNEESYKDKSSESESESYAQNKIYQQEYNNNLIK